MGKYFDSGTSAVSGYASVNLTDPTTGLSIVHPDALYFTNDCPTAGQYGDGPECLACPKHADCPGGMRVRPRHGFCTKGGDLSKMKECNPPNACWNWVGSWDPVPPTFDKGAFQYQKKKKKKKKKENETH